MQEQQIAAFADDRKSRQHVFKKLNKIIHDQWKANYFLKSNVNITWLNFVLSHYTMTFFSF